MGSPRYRVRRAAGAVVSRRLSELFPWLWMRGDTSTCGLALSVRWRALRLSLGSGGRFVIGQYPQMPDDSAGRAQASTTDRIVHIAADLSSTVIISMSRFVFTTSAARPARLRKHVLWRACYPRCRGLAPPSAHASLAAAFLRFGPRSSGRSYYRLSGNPARCRRD